MGYSEEQRRQYENVQFQLQEFDSMKVALRRSKCAVHKKGCKLHASWEEEYHVQISIEDYCCAEFAKEIFDQIVATRKFDSVIIEPAPKDAIDNDNNSSSSCTSIQEYLELIQKNKFDEFPISLNGDERPMSTFISLDRANPDLKIHLCKVIIKRCFSATSGDLIFPADYFWYTNHFFSSYTVDIARPWLSEAITESYNMLLADKPFSKGIIATTFLFGIIEFYVKHELGFRPLEFDFFDDQKREYFQKYFPNKSKTPKELSLGQAFKILLKKQCSLVDDLRELEEHCVRRCEQLSILPSGRWVFPRFTERLTLFRNAMLHGEKHSFYSVGHFLVMLYCLFHLHTEKESIKAAQNNFLG
jgi:hypothetical protein